VRKQICRHRPSEKKKKRAFDEVRPRIGVGVRLLWRARKSLIAAAKKQGKKTKNARRDENASERFWRLPSAETFGRPGRLYAGVRVCVCARAHTDLLGEMDFTHAPIVKVADDERLGRQRGRPRILFDEVGDPRRPGLRLRPSIVVAAASCPHVPNADIRSSVANGGDSRLNVERSVDRTRANRAAADA
jgi:hypothetical protein